jgi:hypothetical protein
MPARLIIVVAIAVAGLLALAGGIFAASFSTSGSRSNTRPRLESSETQSVRDAVAAPVPPRPYQAGDQVYTCAWIAAHPAEAAALRVSCGP